MHSRNEYLKVLRERYLEAETRKEKTWVLDEYCCNTGQARKYVIRKIQPGVDLRPQQRKKKKQTYDDQVKTTLARVWDIFDCPCGQRLKPILEVEVDRLREFGEFTISDEVALKLRQMSSATIDRKLKHQRSEFINDILYKYCCREKLEFTRSRPSRKNDNAYIEQKNWTHVRKILGYLRYDTLAELSIINDLYRGDLRLHKNFLQPVMKLVSKERVGGSVKRKYDTPETPYQRLMDSGQISGETRKQLETVYLNLNPAQLKRSIDAKLNVLYRTYEEKRKSEQINLMRRVVPHTVTSFMIQQPEVALPT